MNTISGKKEKRNRKCRIVMLGHKRIPSREGGIEVVVQELAVRMAGRGLPVTCLNRSGHHVSGKEFDRVGKKKEFRGVRLRTAPAIDKKGIAALTAGISGAVLAAFGRYDVVHFHAEGPALMCWLPKLLGKKVFVTIHGLDHRRAKWGRFARSCILAGEKSAVRFADGIIVLSRDMQTYFRTVYGRETVLIPNGVTRPASSPVSLIRRFGLEKNGYLLFVGRLVPEKGLMYLIKAFKNVQTDKKLVIAGGCSDSSDFAEQLAAEAGGDDRILFTGFVQGQILNELYSNAYLYCLPSDLEGMPLTLLEAMSFGNCCVVSDIPECTEVVEDHAAIFRRSDVFDLQETLQRLCDNRELTEQMKRNAADFICEKYRWEQVVEQTLSLYRRC